MKDRQPETKKPTPNEYNSNPSCPKCGANKPDAKWCWNTAAYGRDYLKISCVACGYSWGMKTKDSD
jgi:hypothetical protein